MKWRYVILYLFLMTGAYSEILFAQQFSFRRLDANSGLSSNTVAQAVFDHNGSLWFSTGEAMNLFDGNTITQFHWRNYPVFPQSETGVFSIDGYNRVWVPYSSKLILIDERRQPHEYILHDTLKSARIFYCFEVIGLGMVAISDKGSFYTADIAKKWNRFNWFDSIRNKQPFTILSRFDSSSFLSKLNNRLLLINFKDRKVLLDIPVPESFDACRLNGDEVMVGVINKWKFYRVSISQNKIIKTYTESKDQYGKPFIAELQSMELAADGKVYAATRFSGLVQFDPGKENFSVIKHDFLSAQSISSDNLRYIASSPDGFLAVTSRAGINITNVFQASFRSMEYFQDEQNNIIDEGVSGLVEDRKGKLWIATQNYLLTLAPGEKKVRKILAIKDISGETSSITPGIPTMDNNGRIWVPYTGYGILVFNDEGRLVKKLNGNSGKDKTLPDNSVRIVKKADNGKMYVGSNNGLYIIDPNTYNIDTATLKPLVKSMILRRVVDILQDGDSLWVTTSPEGAIYNYSLNTGKIKIFTTQDGIASKRNYILAKDKSGNIYASSFDGITVFEKNGKIRLIDTRSGLIETRAEAVITDDQGNIWITNFSTLIRYNPSAKHFDYFDEQNGINKSGLLITPPCKLHNGELVFGLNRGIVFVNPEQANTRKQPVKFALYRVNADNTFDVCSAASPLRLAYHNAKLTFSYLNSDIISGDRILYRYKMDGLDTNWSAPVKTQSITYNLRPGNYRFHVQASYSESNWIDFPESAVIDVAYPFWQRWWFYTLIGILAVAITIIAYRISQSAKEQKRKLEELNRMMNESRLMAIRSQMNPHFIFNSLNAIQECIVMQDFDTAYQYLSKFSKLLRQVLNNSEKNFIPLKDEIEVNRLYLELESLRFKKSFNYSFTVDDNIDTDTVEFPSMLLQPFIENAIWHGLMHKQGEKNLSITFALLNHHIECIIEDNGIGRERSAEIKKKKLGAQYFESKGTKLSEQRIRLLHETGFTDAAIRIDDLKDHGEAKGTRVTLKIPLNHKN